MTRAMNRTLWAAQILAAMIFLFAGVAKLLTPIETLTQQSPLPGWFLRFLGGAEFLGALGLILPRALKIRPALTPLAAACLFPIVAGATVITLASGLAGMAVLPLVTMLLVAFIAYGRSRPGTFRVERSLAIGASPAAIHPLINDFHQWSRWSPYERRDPEMTKTFSGAPAGVGAVYQWARNAQVGEGRMEIVDSTPASVTIQLDFLKPFKGHQTAEFTFAPSGGSTRVTWATFGATNYLSLLMSIFCSMDSLIGKDFEAGLANLKPIAEQNAVTPV
jgi:hypothetical protein